MPGQNAIWLIGGAVMAMALTLFRPSSGARIVLFTLLLAFVALMAMNLSVKGLIAGLLGSD